jgi:hypothetical protein
MPVTPSIYIPETLFQFFLDPTAVTDGDRSSLVFTAFFSFNSSVVTLRT